MSQPKRPKLPKEVLDVLEASGLPWSIEPGSKHHKIIVGKRFAAIWPRGITTDKHIRSVKNVIAQIRRVIREQSPQAA